MTDQIDRLIAALTDRYAIERELGAGPAYMSPEQASGSTEINERADVYTLGVVLYEMLVGEPPFTGPTAQSIVAKALTQEAPSVTLTRSTVPVEVDHAVRTALAKLPADRYRSASDFSDKLRALREAHAGPTTGAASSAGSRIVRSSR